MSHPSSIKNCHFIANKQAHGVSRSLASILVFPLLAAACMPPAEPATPSSGAVAEPGGNATTTSAGAPVSSADEPVPDGVPTTTIRGKRLGYARASLAGNDKEGFSLSLLQYASPTKFGGEVTIQVRGPIAKGKQAPATLDFLQVEDTGPRSQDGVRNISSGGCRGKGSVSFTTLPPFPKVHAEGKELGDATGNLSLDVTCSFDLSTEFGNFSISGPFKAKVVMR